MSSHSFAVPPPPGPPQTPSLDDVRTPPKPQSAPKPQSQPQAHTPPSFNSEERHATGTDHPQRGQRVDIKA